MKINNILLIGILVLTITSCNNTERNNKTSESSTGQNEAKAEKEPYNESIQNVFFGIPFGANYDEVCEKLSQDFWIDDISTKIRLSLTPKKSKKISFGDRSWDCLDLYFSNSRFYGIIFYSTYKTKASAMSDLEGLYSTVSKKYNMKIVQPNDTTIYGEAYGITKTYQQVVVKCYSYESVGHERWIGVSLNYYDLNFIEVSDEL